MIISEYWTTTAEYYDLVHSNRMEDVESHFCWFTHVYAYFRFYSARQERSAPSLPRKPDQHGRYAADQASNKLGTIAVRSTYRLPFAACRVRFLGKLLNYL